MLNTGFMHQKQCLQLFARIRKIYKIDKTIAGVAIGKCTNQLYYFTEECITFKLFDK